MWLVEMRKHDIQRRNHLLQKLYSGLAWSGKGVSHQGSFDLALRGNAHRVMFSFPAPHHLPPSLSPYEGTLGKQERTTDHLPACFDIVGVIVVPVGLFLVKRKQSYPVGACKSLVMAASLDQEGRTTCVQEPPRHLGHDDAWGLKFLPGEYGRLGGSL